MSDNISAFPAPMHAHQAERGMTLRDHFAGLAMQSLLIADGSTNWPQRAREAYEMADEMLKERSK